MTGSLILFSIVGLVSVLVVAVLLRGWVLSVLWGWFAVPIFHLPPLSISEAIAVSLIVSFLTHQYEPSSDDSNWERASFAIIMPFVVLGIGWIVKGYLP